MPELPEVETVRRGLAPALVGRRVARVEQRRAGLRFPFPDDLAARLEGRRVTALERRAKFLIARLDGPEALVAHLGMTGRFLVEAGDPGAGDAPLEPGRFYHEGAGRDAKHDHLVIGLDDGARVTYNDARRFGFVLLVPEAELERHPHFAGMGPEPLGEGFDGAALAARLAGKRTPIKAALLDQRVVAGLGNIYVSEALHRARVAPTRPAWLVTPRESARLAPAIRAVLEEAILAGGSTLRDFAGAGGEAGGFQHRFRVYDRAGAPCPAPRCAGTVERLVQAGRSTFHCPVCQR